MAKIVLLFSLVSSALAACPTGSIFDGNFNKCYKYSASPLAFLSAEKVCNSVGGNLVAVQNAYENSYIAGLAAASQPNTNFWIGSNFLMAAQWKWTSGFNGTYMNFASGQPSDPSSYQCASVRMSDDKWMKELCFTAKPYMCQIDPNASSVGNNCSSSGCSNGYCDPGYNLYADSCKCYKINPGKTTNWKQSSKVCVQDGGQMATIRNAGENNFLAGLAKNYSAIETDPAIGLFCNISDISGCYWVDGSPLSFNNFATGYPVGGNPIFLNDMNRLWYSYDGSHDGTFFCEKAANRMRFELTDDFSLETNHIPSKIAKNSINISNSE